MRGWVSGDAAREHRHLMLGADKYTRELVDTVPIGLAPSCDGFAVAQGAEL